MSDVADEMIRHRLLQSARLLGALVEQRAASAPAADRRALRKQQVQVQKGRESAARAEAHIDRIVAEAPPLTAEQRAKLSVLLAPTDAMWAEWKARGDRIADERKRNRVTVRTAVGLR